jgi:hypothetical protein
MQDFAGVRQPEPDEDLKLRRHRPGFVQLAGALSREIPLTGLAVALWGAVASRRRSARHHTLFLLIGAGAAYMALANFLGDQGAYYRNVLQIGSRLTVLCMLLAALIALGVSDLLERRGTLARGGACLAAGAILVPAVAGHWSLASHHQPRFADRYAKDVFAVLPSRAVLFVGGAELGFPFWYRQQVFKDRRDVDVVTLDQLDQQWYRDQVAHALHVRPLPLSPVLIRQLAPERPVYLDQLATERLRGRVGVRSEGLVNAFNGRSSGFFVVSPDLQQRIRSFTNRAIYSSAAHRWPNRFVLSSYGAAHVALARAQLAEGRRTEAQAQLRLALRIAPYDATARRLLAASRGTPVR